MDFTNDNVATNYNPLEKDYEVNERRLRRAQSGDNIDALYGFSRYTETKKRVGWLMNMHPTDILDEDKRLISAVDYYFIEEDGKRFKVTLPFRPYFYVRSTPNTEQEVCQYLAKKFATRIAEAKVVLKEDLDYPNHLVGIKAPFIKLSFLSVEDLQKLKREVMPRINTNKEKAKSSTTYSSLLASHFGGKTSLDEARGESSSGSDYLDLLIDIREYDVPYHVRVSIDRGIFVGSWYQVKPLGLDDNGVPGLKIKLREDLVDRPDPVVLAYDIETTKLPLKFPDAATGDQIMMISYMVDGQGYLICNREIIAADVDDFEFTPRPEFHGPFIVFNEKDEEATIRRFFEHILELQPNIFVTYNGDYFDWPFVEARALVHGMHMEEHIGFAQDSMGEYKSRPAIHMDCIKWVKRDSYLPVGAHGLKAVAKAKLRYDPVEVDPEDMCRLAREEPLALANYSVSDAVATYYLYMKYVHPFIFALCTIIPMEPDEVLRKGSGTLCEALLMVQAFKANVIFPNKQEAVLNKLTPDGHVLESETYVGGHVEALESGVFKADIPCRFRLDTAVLEKLDKDVERTFKHALEVEEKTPLDTVTNFEEVCSRVHEQIAELIKVPSRLEVPIIYHLDVGAMYPNIILTNRLQPSAMVNENDCAACDFNVQGATCQRQMKWMWRGETMPASRAEFYRIQAQLEQERFPAPVWNNGGSRNANFKRPQQQEKRWRAFHELSREDQAAAEKKRLTDYCRRAYKKTHVTRLEERVDTICQRENSFYVDTVRSFRDRRYTYKGLVKTWKAKAEEALKSGDATEIKRTNGLVVLYDSLQLAHKCILNSFYGYVMRRGARWYCMEMAGIVCYTGAHIITRAREIVEGIGRPLELDTDGIWCVLPASFPENFVFRTAGKKVTVSYPGALLNLMVQDCFTNEQYHELVENHAYSVRNENSIFFEVDGPYLAMILPASKEEGKKLKKRYAVFNFDGSLAELKGFEVKRNGELQLIKIFQSSVFEAFLKGSTLQEVYNSVAQVADYWLDVLYSKAASMPDEELFELICEKRSMSRKLEDYGAQKSTSISTAKRLAEFLGDQMVKDKGLSCRYVIARKPEGAPVTERAIPLAIFQAEDSVRRHFLRRWLKSSSNTDFEIRSILDWNYYIERFNSCVQKIITIPAALQHISNPVPRVRHPDWLHKKLLEKTDIHKQRTISGMFQKLRDNAKAEGKEIMDIEEAANGPGNDSEPLKVVSVNKKRGKSGRKSAALPKPTGSTANFDNWREVLGPPPSMGLTKESIRAWLAYHKRKWRAMMYGDECVTYVAKSGPQRRSRLSAGRRISARGGMSAFLGRTVRAPLEHVWQVIQIHAVAGAPGQFRAWCLLDKELSVQRVVIPRVFYVNLRTPKDEESGPLYRKVNRTLPRSHTVHNLYEYSVPEEVFEKHQTDILDDFLRPEVEGVYELQVPLIFRAMMEMGCLCAVDRTQIRDTDGVNFALSHLEFRTMSHHKYLDPNCDSRELVDSLEGRARNVTRLLHPIYLYCHSSARKQLVCLYLPPHGHAPASCQVFAIDTSRTNQMPNLQAIHSRACAELEEAGEALGTPRDVTFEVRVEVDERQVYRLLQRSLTAYKDERKGPGGCVLVVQSTTPLTQLQTAMPAMLDFPNIPLTQVDPDSDTLYNQLDWQRVGARAFIRHLLSHSEALSRQTERARYLHVPVGNVPADSVSYGCDLFFARHLRRLNAVLWCSEEPRPDLGGKERDDTRLLMEASEGSDKACVVNCPGVYPHVSIALDLSSLAINALLVSNRIDDLEGAEGTSMDAFGVQHQGSVGSYLDQNEAEITSYDETAACIASFRVLKTMVLGWVKDVTQYKNVLADELIMHFYQWLRSPASLLFDPAITRMLQRYMKKLFLKLVEDLQSLDARIVHASFHRVVLATRKATLMEALSYVEYVSNTLRGRELYHAIDLQYVSSWTYLLWMDAVNFGGTKGRLPTDDSELEGSQEEDASPELDMHWHVSFFLSNHGGLRSKFVSILAGFILSVRGKIHSESRRIAETSMDTSGLHLPVGTDVTQSQELLDFTERLLREELGQQLYALTSRVQKKGAAKVEAQDGSRPLPGFVGASHTSSPMLNFVVTLCHVLSLDSAMAETVVRLKRDLLRLLGVGEFAPEAVWRDPCTVVVIPEVPCQRCNYIRDLDLCRDIHMERIEERWRWTCSHCGLPYPTEEIEQRLLHLADQQCLQHALQDLTCSRCRGVAETNMAALCQCAGAFENTQSKSDTRRLLTVYKEIAEAFDMEVLMESTKWLLEMSG